MERSVLHGESLECPKHCVVFRVSLGILQRKVIIFTGNHGGSNLVTKIALQAPSLFQKMVRPHGSYEKRNALRLCDS